MRRLLVGIVAIAVLVVPTACSGESNDARGADGSTDSSKQDALGTAQKGEISLRSGWVAATPGGTSRDKGGNRPVMSAGYAEIANAGSHDEKLVGASSPAADMVELHETVDLANSAGTMRPVDHIVVPAGGSVTLRPGGYHLMIMGLHHGLRPGTKLEVDLRFASGTRVPVEFFVIDRTDRPGVS